MSANLPLIYSTNILNGITLGPNQLTACPVVMTVAIDSGTHTNDASATLVSATFDNPTFFNFVTAEALPKTLRSDASNTNWTFNLSARVGECASGARIGTLTLTMSSLWISGNADSGASTAYAIVSWSNPVTSLTTTIYAVNLPFPSDTAEFFCLDEHSRLYIVGEI